MKIHASKYIQSSLPGRFKDPEADWAYLFTRKSFQSLGGSEIVKVPICVRPEGVPVSGRPGIIQSPFSVALNYHHNVPIYLVCQVLLEFHKRLNYCSKYQPLLPWAEISQKEAGNIDSLA